LQVILDGPDLGHDFSEEDHDETDEDYFDQEFEKPEALLEEDFVDEEVSKNNDRYIDDAVGDEQRGEQRPGFFEQGDDPSPGGVLFCFQDIDVLIGQD